MDIEPFEVAEKLGALGNELAARGDVLVSTILLGIAGHLYASEFGAVSDVCRLVGDQSKVFNAKTTSGGSDGSAS